MNCLYAPFKFRFCGTIAAKNGRVFENFQRVVCSNQENKGLDMEISIVLFFRDGNGKHSGFLKTFIYNYHKFTIFATQTDLYKSIGSPVQKKKN